MSLGPRLERIFAAMRRGEEVDIAELQAATFEYFDNEPQPNEYFNALAGMSLPAVAAVHMRPDPMRFGLLFAHQWEKAHPARRLHKGTPYYFMGMALIISGDLDYGFLYMHQALLEDQLSSGRPDPQQPAWFFATMNSRRAEQAFRAEVRRYAAFIQTALAAYRRTGRGALTFDKFRQGFTTRQALLEPLFHLVYAIARTQKLEEMFIPSRSTVFGRNMYGQALFDLCLVAEELLGFRWRTNRRQLFAALADNYIAASGLRLSQAERAAINTAASSSWGTVAMALLDGSYRTAGRRSLGNSETDLMLAYLVRNKSAHTLAADAILETHFPEMERRVFWALARMVEYLP